MAWMGAHRQAAGVPAAGARAIVQAGLQGTLSAVTHIWVRHGQLLGALMLAVFLACVMAVGWLRPDRNWDMLAYIAAVWQDAYPDATSLHAAVFETVRAGVDPAEYEALTTGDAWRVRQATDSQAFVSMLGMYDVKWLYVELLRLAMPLSGPVRAGLVINTAAAAMLGAVLVWWLAVRRMLNVVPFVIAGLVVLGLPSMAVAKTPDMLTAVLVTSGFLFLDRDKLSAGFAALLAAVLVRPDSAAIAGVLMASAWYWRDRMAGAAAFGFAAALAAYVFVSAAGNHPGWWPHLWFSTFHMQDTMQGFAPDLSLGVYVTAFAWNIVRSIFENTWLAAYALIVFVWGILHSRGAHLAPRAGMLLSAALLAVAAKFVIFPLHDGRTYLPLLIPAGLLLLAGWRERRAA